MLTRAYFYRWRKDDYENLDEETILKRFSKLKIPVPSEPMSALDELMKLEHTRNLKVWHDHSDILNHSYVSFMISALYDTAVYLTDEEFKERYPDRTPVDVQSAVEKPYLYILGQSKATDVDQLSYTSTRLEDINSLHQPTYFKGTAIYDVLRVFSGDGSLDSLKQDIKEVETSAVFVVFLLKNTRTLSVLCGSILQRYLRE